MGLLSVVENIIYPWPVRCLACGKANRAQGILCEKCGDEHMNERPLVNFAHAPGIDASAAAHMYTRQAAAVVRAMKYRAVGSLKRDMARDMLEAAKYAGFTLPDVVTYVPMHWMRSRNRHYNQSRVLANAIAREIGAAATGALARVRPCRRQATLRDDEARHRNVRDAFRAKTDLAGKRVLLVDDVYTTGATAGECAMTLRRAGADRVMLLVYATAYKSHNA